MKVDGRKIVIVTKDDQAQARPRRRRRWRRPTRTTRPTSPSAPPRRPRRWRMLPVAEEQKKILIVEPAVADQITGEKWNRYIFRTGAQLVAGRDLQRARDRQARRHGRDAGAGLRLRPRRRRRLQGGAGEDRRDAGGGGICAGRHHRLHRAGPAAVRRAQGQAGPQDHLGDLGRRRRSAGQAAGHGPEALRHRALHRRQHPARAGGLQAPARHGRRDLLLLRHSRRTR